MTNPVCWRPVLAQAAALSLLLGPAAAAPRDTFLARVEALAEMQTLNAELLASRSATATLDAWCATQGFGGEVRAERVRGPGKPIRPEQRAHLAIGPDEAVGYRRVRLTCGGRVLSEADNWYVPSRLTPAMNEALDTTETPYGKVIAPLAPRRQTLDVAILWQVLPKEWATRPPPDDHPDETLDVPLILFEHDALVFDAANRPLAEVEEHYTRDILPSRR